MAAVRDALGGTTRYRRRCGWHHVNGSDQPAPDAVMPLADGSVCAVNGCTRVPEAFRRPDGRVYVRDVCRAHRRRKPAKKAAPRLQRGKGAAVVTADAPMTLSGKHKGWSAMARASEHPRAWRQPVVRVKGGHWVREDQEGWFVPKAVGAKLVLLTTSTFDLAKQFGLPSRVVVAYQGAHGRGKL